MAAYVEKVKGKKALIILDGMEVSSGDTVEAFDPDSKKKTAILKVTSVKSNKAIAQVLRGKVKPNQTIETKSVDMPTSREKPKSKSTSTFAIGGLFGVGFDTMEIKIGSPQETVEQTGMGLSLMGAADYKLTDLFSLRGVAGVEQFNAKATATTAVCTSTTNCETKITYFTGAIWGKIHFSEAIWFGGGIGLQHPLSTSTNALDEATLGASAVYLVGGGADISLGSDMYIPLQIEYGMQPSSDEVSSTYYGARLGLMLRY